MDQYAVIGYPIKHSLSPLIHTLFAEQLGETITYTAIESPVDGFQDTLSRFRKQGGCGVNVTVPFKLEAFQLADQISELAERAKAVNTLCWQDDQLVGYNTDGIGLLADLTQHQGLNLQGKRILVLGAGGAVRGILAPLLAEAPFEVAIANRTQRKAEALVEEFFELGPVRYQLPSSRTVPFDVIINGTSSSLTDDRPFCDPSWFNADTFVYDMMYGAKLPSFLAWVKAQGVLNVADGLGMLVEQAASAYEIWRGKRPETASVLAHVRASLV